MSIIEVSLYIKWLFAQGYLASRLPECVCDSIAWKITDSAKARIAAKKNKSK